MKVWQAVALKRENFKEEITQYGLLLYNKQIKKP